MKTRWIGLLVLVAGLALALTWNVAAQETRVTGPPATGRTGDIAQGNRPASEGVHVTQALRSSPVMFIENVGQFDERARFQMRGGDRTIWLAEDSIWISIVEPKSKGAEEPRRDSPLPLRTSAPPLRRSVNLKLTFPGANPHPRLEPFDRLDTHVSYFIGNDPAQWRPDVPVWGGVRYVDLYPGVDLVVGAGLAPAAAQGQQPGSPLLWQLEVREGADLSALRLRIAGAGNVAPSPVSGEGRGGGLLLTTAVGDFTLPLLTVEGLHIERSNVAPTGVQRLDARTFDVSAPFSRSASIQNQKSQIQNQAALAYAGFLGGSGDDFGDGIAVDGAGNAYVTGETKSGDFPAVVGPDLSYNGGGDNGGDAFVAKVKADGTGLAYAGFLGGSGYDWGYGIAVDGAGNAYVTGDTWSSDFPAVVGPDLSYNGGGYYGGDAFVAKVNAAGTGLAYAGFLGGSDEDWGGGIAVDGAGNAYVTGVTKSGDFPAVVGPDLSFNGSGYYGGDAFVAKVNTAGTGLAYAGFLGGSNDDWGNGIAVDGAGNAYVTGFTDSGDFPAVVGPDLSLNGNADAFVAKVKAAGTGLTYAGFLGGSGRDGGHSIAVDGAGNAYVTGMTLSGDFPAVVGPDLSYNGGWDAFVAKVNAAGTGLAYAGFLGGSNNDWGDGIAVDGAGNAYVTGWTDSGDFPAVVGPDLSFNGGSVWGDAFVAKVNAAGTGPVYAGFLGGSDDDRGNGIAVDGAGNAYVTGGTDSGDFPAVVGPDLSLNGGWDAFVVKLAKLPDLSTSTKQPGTLRVTLGQTVTYTIALANTGTGDATSARLTDTLPVSLTYQAGSLWADGGSYGAAGGVITWTGAITAGTATTVRYAAVVSPALSVSDTVALVNRAQVDDGVNPPLERAAAVFINPFQVQLPLVARGYSP